MTNNCKYGDESKVSDDTKTLKDIFNRQGSSFLLDVLAELVGDATRKFTLRPSESKYLKTSLVNELSRSIDEWI